MELAHGGSVVHGVKGRNLVDSHGGHLEQTGNLVHDADAGEAVLALAEVEERHDSGLLVLRGVSLEDLGHDLFILGVELEWEVGVVVRSIPVLQQKSSSVTIFLVAARPRSCLYSRFGNQWALASASAYKGSQKLTTESVSLRRLAVREMARDCCGRAERATHRAADRKRRGVSLLAMIAAVRGGPGRRRRQLGEW